MRALSSGPRLLIREVRVTLAAITEEFPHVNGERMWHLLTQLRVLDDTLRKLENEHSQNCETA